MEYNIGDLSHVIDEEAVTRHVSRLFNYESVRVIKWETDVFQFQSYALSTKYILSVSVTVQLRDRRHRPRLLVKFLQKPTEIEADNDWDREVLAYERLSTHLLSTEDFRTPKFLGADRPTPDTARLWLEYVDGKPATLWSLRQWRALTLGLAALQMGFVENDLFLSEPWLNHGDLRKWIERDRANIFPIRFTSSLRRLLGPFLEPEVVRIVAKLWRERNHFLDRLDQLPQTLCHNDIWSGNAVAEQLRGNLRRSVVFDWQLVGPGPIGSDPAFAVVAGIWLMLFPGTKIEQLQRALLSGYVAGLKQAGRVDLAQHAREAFALTAAMRYALMLPQLLIDLTKPERMSAVITHNGVDASKVLRQRADLIRAGARWAKLRGII